MATRDDILLELGLAPTWRLRTDHGQPVRGAATTSDTAVVDARDDAGANIDARTTRIASLDWPALHDDIAACTAAWDRRTQYTLS